MNLQASICGLMGLVAIVFFYWDRFSGQDSKRRQWVAGWFFRGALVPIAAWFFLNAGFFGLPPLMPEVEFAKGAKGLTWWGFTLLDVTGDGIWIIGSYWCAISLAWLVAAISTKIDRSEFLPCLLVCSGVALPLLFYFVDGWEGVGLAGMLWMLPIIHFTLPLTIKQKVVPIYAGAVAKLQRDRYDEAEVEVIKQLEMCEDDFEGWMMLATLYAEQHKDLAVAEKTIFELCAQPNLNPSQISVAFNRLADWYLKMEENPVAARRVLQEVENRFPDSHLAKMVAIRIRQLPPSREEMAERKRHRPVHLPSIGARLFTGENSSGRKLTAAEAALEANKLADRLKTNPNDVELREEFARILAEPLEKLDAAVEQIHLLLELPDQKPAKRAEWFGLLASWEMKHRHDAVAARKYLEKVIQHYPNTPQAFAAAKQINLMEIDARVKNVKPVKETLPRIQVT